ncbi:spore germination protein [Bacillus sp. BRMEA1]|uniref:spore germination protein n=1 Tax=Neobacillus endophyticus TaxID=2738405 RepID=UPI0015632255|nr:spore germination protein [Neobacillus endophyticus]NRD80108.1 spore germination protein [Neobacillus endophyticus]
MGFFNKTKNRVRGIIPNKSSIAHSSGQNILLKMSLEVNLEIITEMLGNSTDIIIRKFRFGERRNIHAAILYTESLTDHTTFQHFVLEPLMLEVRKSDLEKYLSNQQNLFEDLKDIIAVGEVKDLNDLDTLLIGLVSGDAILLIDGYDQALSLGIRKWKERNVSEPTSQTVVRGSQEGFNENFSINTALIRRRIKNPNLRVETKSIGKISKTAVRLMYIEGIVKDKVVEEVRQRLDRIDLDAIMESGTIEELIQDKIYTPFPTVFNTERPDVATAALLEGRVAILVDGTPYVLIVPALFVHFFQSPDDYSHRSDIGTLIRMLRFLTFFIALIAPSLYVAVTTYHQEMIPTPLLISLAAQREGVPFPAFIEAMMMEITFEIIREAGVRMPRAIGPAVSIVGTLVVGTAAVDAGIVSAAMVIVVAITAISSFVFPNYNIGISVRMLRFLLMCLAGSFGLFGITVGLIALVLHLCSLRSFGIPYMTPLAPFISADIKDSIFRFTWWKLTTRPQLLNEENVVRQQQPAMAQPKPPKSKP